MLIEKKLQEINEACSLQMQTVQKMLKAALGIVVEGHADELEQIKQWEMRVNEREVEIDHLCVSTMALCQPEASDLRLILMIAKMNAELERLGDLALDIAENGVDLISLPKIKPYVDVPRMGEIALRMLGDAVNSFINSDEAVALTMQSQDDELDQLHNQVFRELLTYMAENQKFIEPAIKILRISKDLERIGDRAVNIAEKTIFVVKGIDIKHSRHKM